MPGHGWLFRDDYAAIASWFGYPDFFPRRLMIIKFSGPAI